MVTKRWSQIERLYHAARELRTGERAAFLDSACGGDGSLKREVESLLDNDKEQDPFLETPALQAAAGVLEQVVSTQTQATSEGELVGQTISHYQIVAELGRGGMGVVYKAEDTLLGRPVALKFLRRELGSAASSPLGSLSQENALERFRREARAASALNHPNICIVHDVGWHEGGPFMVLEYLEGRTLRESIETGPLAFSTVIELGIQIADALAAAHAKGIIHRDIKPTNILVTPAGQVKVLDFGLAKPQPKDPQSPAAGTSLTNPGIAVGTVAYMSPEQARGEEVDARSDLFSLGIVLYEVATGHRPFAGDSGIATLHQIVAEQPKPMREWNPHAPPELERIVAKALEKDRDLRFQSAAELRSDLMRLKRTSSQDGPAIAPSVRSRTRQWRVLTALAATAVGIAGWIVLRPAKAPRILEYKQLTNDGVMKQLVATDGVRLYLNESSGTAHWTAEMTVNGGTPTRLPMMSPRFALLDVSPDGTALLTVEISSYERQLLWIVPVLGAPPYRLGNLEGSSGAWSPDGQQIAYSKGSELFITKKDGSGARKVCEAPGGVAAPAWSPDGKRIRFTLTDEAHHSEAIWEVTSEGRDAHLIFPSHGPSNACCGHWTPDGRNFVFSEFGQIWVLPEAHGFVRGTPHAEQLTTGATAFAAPLPSKDGKRLFAGGYTPRGEAIRYDKRRKIFVPLLQGMSADFVTFSKGGQWIAYVTFPEGVLWRSRADYTERVQLTQPEPYSYALVPRWSPDGAKIAFGIAAPGKLPRLYIVSFAGGGPEELPLPANEPAMDPTWSPDGKRICYGGTSATVGKHAGPNIHIIDLESHQITDVPGSQNYFSPRWSPDGRYIAALSVDASRLGLFDFSTGTWRDIETGSFLSFPYWSHDGKSIYHIQGTVNPAVMRIALDGHCEQVVDLRDVRLSGFFSFSLSLTPADDPILVLDRGSEEVFALELEKR